MDYIGLGRRVRAKRKALRMKQRDLSAASGVSISFLGHIERGSRKASIDTLVRLALTLQTTPDALLQDSLYSASLTAGAPESVGCFAVIRRQLDLLEAAVCRGSLNADGPQGCACTPPLPI